MVEYVTDLRLWGKAFGIVATILAGAAVYMLPGFIAARRKHRNLPALLCLNLLLGWTVAGWVAALIWALYRERPASPRC